MTNPFIHLEIALYIIPIAMIVIYVYFKDLIHHLFPFKVTLAMILTPFWIVNIALFSLLIFGFNLFPFIFAVCLFVAAFYLYDYIKGRQVFKTEEYLSRVFNYAFIICTFFMISLMILRIILLFPKA